MATIAIFNSHKWEEDRLKKELKPHKVLLFTESIDKKHIPKIKNVDAVSLFVQSKLTKEIIDALPNLKLITCRSTGYDMVDLEAAKAKKIPVCNVPFYGENTVAEHAFALILSLSRNVHKSYLRSTKNNYSLEGLTGFDLKGKTLGVVGGGHIGMHIARMAKGFGMNVLVFDIFQNEFMSEVLDFEYATLNSLLAKSDVISLHVPYNKHTHHLINMTNVKKVKKGAMLINTSRGAVIDNKALKYALDKGIFGSAGLDVIEGENILTNQKFRLSKDPEIQKLLKTNKAIVERENVLFTPHNAFNSQEALNRILDTSIANLKKGLLGKVQNNVLK